MAAKLKWVSLKCFQNDLACVVFIMLTNICPFVIYFAAGDGALKHVLRNWRFEASMDKTDWDVLAQHHDDVSLKEEVHASASWPLQATRPYRHIRIICAGRNSSHHFFTHFGSVEVWGTLLKLSQDI
jgi:hypothetical protein